MKAQISRWGNSLAVRIPKALAAGAGMEEGARVRMDIDHGRLVITPLEKEFSLQELVKGIHPKNRHQETDWEESMGNEVW